MSILKNIHVKDNLIFFVFLKVITIIILIWIDNSYDNVFTYGRIIGNKYKGDSTLNIILKRYMSDNEDQNESGRTLLYKNSPYAYDNKRSSIYDDYVSTYGTIKNRDSVKLKLYKTSYRHRYSKKKGLARLDCYYENKLFDKFDYINDLSEKLQHDKKALKKIMTRKYYIPLILFSLLPLLGFLFPILFAGKRGNRIIPWTSVPHGKYGSEEKCLCTEYGYIHLFTTKYSFKITYMFNALITIILAIIIILIIFYILKKLIKYEGLKAGKGVMNRKDYFNFFKETFQNKKN
ncbi:hypothetical protein PVMG_05522 [Plasmodium vivax Mauritania I]|uniref:Variable surface protein n=1 Tax=Plasmodium vivax Mauritania I TaxID=1035515 RepID=A0A0J9TIN5_PLAVI|nr:hypothetical protein PVMG_05522 [Plasmodium vivax Mauritania I]